MFRWPLGRIESDAAMLARTSGIIAGLAIFTVYFAFVGANPVLETLLGVVLALIGGFLTWWFLHRWARMEDSGRR